MLILITGHPRSGTELLTRLLNTHPDIAITLELGSFRTLWTPPKLQALALWESFRGRRFPIRPDTNGAWRGWRAWVESYRFFLNLIWELRAFRHHDVGPNELEICYKRITGKSHVGDKLPAYSLSLDQFAAVDNLKCVVVYRHLFSVVRSYLELVEGNWKNIPTLNRLNTPEKVAQNWASSVKLLKRHWNRVLPLCYETLCKEPGKESERLSHWLQVDSAGFDTSLIFEPRPLPVFAPQQVAQMLKVAGEELDFLGYSV